MKKKILAVLAVCIFMAGCQTAPTDKETVSETKPDSTAVSENKNTPEDTLFIGYGRQDLFSWGNADSYVVNKEGKKIIEMSSTQKTIIDIDGRQYAVDRVVGNTVENEHGWYDYDYNYVVYDDTGEKIGEMEGISYAQYISDGRFYGYNNKERKYYIFDILSGERKDTNTLEILYRNNEAIGFIQMDENYNFKGISDLDGNLIALDMYDSAYPISTDSNTFLVAQLKLDEARQVVTEADRYRNRIVHLLTLEGEKVVDMDFDNIYAQEDVIFARDSGATFVLDGKTGEVLRGFPGEVVAFNEKKGVFIKVEESEEARYGRIYSLIDFDMNVLSTGWEGYSDMYRGGTDEYYMFYKYEDPETYYSSMYIVNTKGEITFGPFEEKDAWVVAMCENCFLTQSYDSENGRQVYEIFDYDGKKSQFEKDYVSIQRQYNNDGYTDYFIAAYENPVSAGHIYDIIDMDLNVVHSGFNYVYLYGVDSGRFVSVSQGFDIGIFDVEEGSWIYKERSFNSLED